MEVGVDVGVDADVAGRGATFACTSEILATVLASESATDALGLLGRDVSTDLILEAGAERSFNSAALAVEEL